MFDRKFFALLFYLGSVSASANQNDPCAGEEICVTAQIRTFVVRRQGVVALVAVPFQDIASIDIDDINDSPANNCKSEQQIEGERDEAARLALEEILSSANSSSWEYGGYLVRGSNGQVSLRGLDTNQLCGEYTPGFLPLVPGETIVGFVHNHPMCNGARGSRTPSGSDWSQADAIVRSPFSNAFDFALYIVEGGELYEYDYNDQSSAINSSRLSDQEFARLINDAEGDAASECSL